MILDSVWLTVLSMVGTFVAGAVGLVVAFLKDAGNREAGLRRDLADLNKSLTAEMMLLRDRLRDAEHSCAECLKRQLELMETIAKLRVALVRKGFDPDHIDALTSDAKLLH